MENPNTVVAAFEADDAPIDRRALHDTVLERLRARIVEGRLSPGARLNERELCEQLGVSRTPLREAIKTLAAEGLAELLPHRGARVARMSREAARHTFELMAHLEALNGELAARRVTDAQLAEIRTLHARMLQAHARRDLAGYYWLNKAIHERIGEAAGNPVVAATYQTVNRRIESLRFRTNLDPAEWDRAVAEHEAMVQALAARDARRLSKVLREHVRRKAEAVLAQMTDPDHDDSAPVEGAEETPA